MKGFAFCAALAILFLNSGAAKPFSDYIHVEDFYVGSDDNRTEATTILPSTPRLLSTSVDLTGAVGESVTLPCLEEFPDDVAVLWKKMDTVLILGTNSLSKDDRFQLVNRSSLKISALVPTDSGDYICQVSTEPSQEVTHHLEVISAPSHHGGSCSGKSSKWIDLGGDYCYIIEKDADVGWFKAVYQCFQEGGSLATLRNIQELKRIHHHIQDMYQHFYIGLWKHNEGSFEWVDKNPSNFRSWADGEPNDRDETCVEMYPNSAKWNDVPCYASKGYICSSLKSQPARDSKYVCPASSPAWKDYGFEHCYIIEVYNTTTSHEAAARCSAAGGTLASFHSVEEIAVIREQVTDHYGNFHIGLRQSADGTFEWMDRSPIDLDFWASGEPNDMGEECAEMYHNSGHWNDIPCDQDLGYICSTPKVNPEIEATELPQSLEGVSCGGDITAESGTIQSPNYPYNYGPNTHCIWKITVPENSQIQLNFQTLTLEYGGSCEYDYVEVLDGHEPESTVLRKLCGSESQQIIESSRNKMAVKFSSDQVNQRTGFLATFTKVPQCGENIVAEEGVIQSRNYPNNYLPNDICIWKITVPEDKAVLLKFKAFQTEEGEDCVKDYVEILDGHDETGAILGRKCGLYQTSTYPLEVRSSGHKITVRFLSDGNLEYYGFLAEFQAVEVDETASFIPPPPPSSADYECQNAIDYEKGILVSPRYPEEYRSDESCTWTIRGPPGSIINLRFKTFQLESSGTCSYDFVKVLDGNEDSSASLGTFCGSTSPGLITSSRNEMTVKFQTDSSVASQGFAAFFSTSEGSVIEPDVAKTEEGIKEVRACGEDIIADQGILKSPGYPENYGPNEKCTWKITVPIGHQVVLKFNEFRVENHTRCAYDYVLVRDGHTPLSPLLAKLCGTEIPVEVRSSKNKLMIEFHSDSSVEHSGFSAEFKKDLLVVSSEAPSHELVACGGDIDGENRTIESPNYPNPYGPLQNCTWKITVPENELVRLKFERVQLESSPLCSFDKVTVFDGDNVNSPVISTLCEYDSNSFVSSKNQMTVQFTSDASFEAAGFTATLQKVALCGENITADEGVLQSPDITYGYMCSWSITVPENYTVSLKIHADPKDDYFEYSSFHVELHDGPDKYSHSLRQYSALDQNFSRRSTGNKMFVSVFSDGSNGLPRFYAEFEKAICGGNIVADSGIIMNPGYPNSYMPNENCVWTITVPEGYKVLLTFQAFQLEESSSCRYDFVEVYDGGFLFGDKLGRYCGLSPELPDALRSTDNKMTVIFRSDGDTEFRGFSAQFTKEAEVPESVPVSSEDIENMLRQLPNIIFENAQRKGKPSRGKKTKRNTIAKRSLLYPIEDVFKLL